MNEQQYAMARKRVKKKKEFYKNFLTWLLVSNALLLFNALNYHGHWWAIYPFLGWGLGVLFQALDVFGFPGYGNDWEERELEKEVTRLKMSEEIRSQLPAPTVEEKTEKLDLSDWRQKSREARWRDEDFV